MAKEKDVFQSALDKASELEKVKFTDKGIDIDEYYSALEQIAIKNNKQKDHTILRFNGIHEIIPSGQYKILTINSTPELNFWNSVKNSEMEKLGLHLVSDERVVVKIEKMLNSKDTVI